MKYYKNISQGGKVLLVYAVGIIYLLTTDPQKLPSFLLILPFLILFVAIYLTIVELFRLLRRDENQKVVGFSVSKPRRIAALIAALPTLLLILQSIGQLTVRDTLTTLAIFVIGYFYLVRFSAISIK